LWFSKGSFLAFRALPLEFLKRDFWAHRRPRVMSVDDRENHSDERLEESPFETRSIAEALQSETDEPLPPAAEAIAERDARRAHPITPQGRRRRYLTRRNAAIATIAAGVGLIALILLLLLVYRLGYVDRYVASQVKDTFSKYGIRAEIRDFHTTFPPQTVEMLNLELYDTQTGERLGRIDRVLATIRIEDLYALSLNRNIDLKDLKIEGLEAWVAFDEQGRSNLRNVHIPPPETNRRILLAYTAADIEIKS